MNGLAGRLRQVEGVEDVELDVGEGGIDGIRVRLEEGTDEMGVLDQIHKLLAAYGLRTRRLPVAVNRGVAPRETTDGSGVAIEAVPVDGELEVRLRGAGRAVIRRGEPTPEGAVGAMAAAVAGWQGRAEPQVGGVAIRRVGGHRVLTVVLDHAGEPRAGAAVVGPGFERALHDAVTAAFPPVA